jgi:hypothetical protein
MKSIEEIHVEIVKLTPQCKNYDTVLETRETCLAVGAHDALRWVLRLAEIPISELL